MSIDLDDPEFWSKMLPEVPDLDEDAAKAMDAAAIASGADRLRAAPRPVEVDELDLAFQRGKELSRKRAREEAEAAQAEAAGEGTSVLADAEESLR